jgi:hypothetical protein
MRYSSREGAWRSQAVRPPTLDELYVRMIGCQGISNYYDGIDKNVPKFYDRVRDLHISYE